MKKSEEIRKLLEDNRTRLLDGQDKVGICYDGIVCEEKFPENHYNFIFLLKETNGNDNGKECKEKKDWDYVNWILHQQAENEEEVFEDGSVNKTPFYSPTFSKLYLWSSIFADILKKNTSWLPKYLDGSRIKIPEKREIFKKIGVVNLKKTWGKEATNYKELKEYALKTKDILMKEIEIINPMFVVCGSSQVYAIMKSMLKPERIFTKESKVIPKRPLELFIHNYVVYINFYHPAARGENAKFADYAVETFTWVNELF